MGSITSAVNRQINAQTMSKDPAPSQSLFHPRLACQVTAYVDRIVLSHKGQSFNFPNHGRAGERLQKLFWMMDGTRSIRELQEFFSPDFPDAIDSLLRNLNEQGLIDDVERWEVRSGIDTLIELETLSYQLLAILLKKNAFWKSIQSTKPQLPSAVLYGFAIEQYHLLSRRGEFYAPLLGFQNSAQIRQLIGDRYSAESAQEQKLLEALGVLGIRREDLADTMPLPETMALCNGLTHWANFDPQLFLSLWGILEGLAIGHFESYLETCQRLKLDPQFVTPIAQLVEQKRQNKPERFSHELFQAIPCLDEATVQRFRGKIYLFVELYDNVYRAIWNHYLSTNDLLRRVSVI